MNKILFGALAVIVMACSGDVNPSYKSMSGEWYFTGPDVSGEFVIEDNTLVSGNFTIENQSFKVDREIVVIQVPESRIINITLVNDAAAAYVTLYETTHPKGYGDFTAQGYRYQKDFNPQDFPGVSIKVKRVK